jgi:acetyl/propionyl-CoA carboxylase alpha subunit
MVCVPMIRAFILDSPSHPSTQINTAAGNPPDLMQTLRAPYGASIEVRLYAEDPLKDFQPCSGTLTEVAFPLAESMAPSSSYMDVKSIRTVHSEASLPLSSSEQDNLSVRGEPSETAADSPHAIPMLAPLRVDTWVASGTLVTPHYDPMLGTVLTAVPHYRKLSCNLCFAGKLIVHGIDRADAVARLRAALATTRLGGITTNLQYLRAIAGSAAFASGALWTRYLESAFSYAPRAVLVRTPERSMASRDASHQRDHRCRCWRRGHTPASRTGQAGAATGRWACRPLGPWTPSPSAWATR